MDKKLESYLKLSTKNIRRYSVDFMVQPESTSDHIHDMSCIALMVHEDLKDKLDFSLESVIFRIFLHDLPESLTGDVIHTFKHHDSSILHEMNRVEREMLEEMGVDPWIIEYSLASKDYSSLEGIIVSFLDFLQVLTKAYTEVEIYGNKGFLKIQDSSKEWFTAKLEAFSSPLDPNNVLKDYFLDIVKSFN